MKNDWLDALVKLYEKKLYLGTNMMKGSKREKMEGYLEVLEQARQEVMGKKDKKLEELLKSYYHDLYVIKEENIPHSVYEQEQRLARERGYGNIQITEGYKKEKNKEIITNQKESLDKWIEYFLWDDEAKSYSGWEVFWVLEGLQKLGIYDKEKHKYAKRDKTTIYPYPEVKKQAVFNSIGMMEEYLKSKKSPEDIKTALGQANFKSLYEYSLEQLMLEGKEECVSNEGIWIKYDQGSDYNKLRNSLQGYKTGWCTAAGESFARDQLAHGDFYVYYSKDKNGEYNVPRIAIRMDGQDTIGEIRGIAKDQNIEEEMLPILDEKLKEFPDRGKYLKKERDMMELTEIDKKIARGEELTIPELRFIYELDSNIEGFGWSKDPRIEDIRAKRDFKLDLSRVFKCLPDEISNNKVDVIRGKKIVCFYGELDLSSLINDNGLVLPDFVYGTLNLNNLVSVSNLKLPNIVSGDLVMHYLLIANNIIFPNIVGGSLHLSSLERAKGLKLPNIIGGALDLNSLFDAEGLLFPNSVGGYVDLSSLQSAKGLKLPDNIVGSLYLDSLTDVEGLSFPNNIEGLSMKNLKNAKNIKLPEIVGDELNLWSLENAENVILPNRIGSCLSIKSLYWPEGLIIPDDFEYDFVFGTVEVEQYIAEKMQNKHENRK